MLTVVGTLCQWAFPALTHRAAQSFICPQAMFTVQIAGNFRTWIGFSCTCTCFTAVAVREPTQAFWTYIQTHYQRTGAAITGGTSGYVMNKPMFTELK